MNLGTVRFQRERGCIHSLVWPRSILSRSAAIVSETGLER